MCSHRIFCLMVAPAAACSPHKRLQSMKITPQHPAAFRADAMGAARARQMSFFKLWGSAAGTNYELGGILARRHHRAWPLAERRRFTRLCRWSNAELPNVRRCRMDCRIKSGNDDRCAARTFG